MKHYSYTVWVKPSEEHPSGMIQDVMEAESHDEAVNKVVEQYGANAAFQVSSADEDK